MAAWSPPHRLCAPVPQLVCPFFGDQFDNGQQLKRLGVACVVRLKRYSEKRAFAALHRLLDTPVATKCARALAPAMAHDDGPAIIASWVAERLTHHADQRLEHRAKKWVPVFR